MAEENPTPPAVTPTRPATIWIPRWLLVVSAAIVAIVLAGLAFAVGHHAGERHGGFVDHGGGGRGVGVIVVLIVVALVIAAAVLVVRHFGSRPLSARNAEAVLADRFARGEIDEDEFVRRRDALRS